MIKILTKSTFFKFRNYIRVFIFNFIFGIVFFQVRIGCVVDGENMEIFHLIFRKNFCFIKFNNFFWEKQQFWIIHFFYLAARLDFYLNFYLNFYRNLMGFYFSKLSLEKNTHSKWKYKFQIFDSNATMPNFF